MLLKNILASSFNHVLFDLFTSGDEQGQLNLKSNNATVFKAKWNEDNSLDELVSRPMAKEKNTGENPGVFSLKTGCQLAL